MKKSFRWQAGLLFGVLRAGERLAELVAGELPQGRPIVGR
jgi:hypothetical protein